MTRHRRCVVIFLAIAACGLLPAEAAQPEPARVLAQMARSGYLRFYIASGEIRLSGRRLGNIASSSSTLGRSEKLTMQLVGGQRRLQYERTSRSEQLTVEVNGDRQVHIRRTPYNRSAVVPLDFSQTPGQPTTLALGAEGSRRVYEAPGLWHLLIVHQQPCRQHLIPVLELLSSDWQLVEASEVIERELVGAATTGDLPDSRQWAALVEQLSDDRFARREAAERQLRAFGPALLGYLRRLDFAALDAEQQYRVRRIILALSYHNGDDQPAVVARRLLAEQTIWLALLERPQEPVRQVAARQLARLLGRPIDFDPQAEAKLRQQQIEKLQKEIGRKPPDS